MMCISRVVTLERFTRKADTIEGVERLALRTTVLVEIAARFVGKNHRLDMQRVHDPAMQFGFCCGDHAT